QLEARVVGAAQEGDARPVWILNRSLEQCGAEPLQPRDVRLDVLRVEPEVLEAVMRLCVAPPPTLVGARAGDVPGDAVLARAPHEAVAEHARLVVDDLEAERGDVPLRGLAWIGRLQMNVVDPIGHGLTSGRLSYNAAMRLGLALPNAMRDGAPLTGPALI